MPKISPNKQLHKEAGQVVGLWHAMSSTEQGIKHYVIAIGIDNPAEDTGIGQITFMCSCKGSQYNQTCWHIEQAKELFDE